MKRLTLIIFLLAAGYLNGQYYFSGNLDPNAAGKTVYLSLVEDYRKTTRPYADQIIRKTTSGPEGRFEFRGTNLSPENRIYRIHVDDCEDSGAGAGHFLTGCNQYRAVHFLARNQDTILFPDTLEGEVFCDIQSTNPNSRDLLEVDALKEQMILDFTEFPSPASRELNMDSWFGRWKDQGRSTGEPLTELYIYAFLSDRGSETHDYYLKDLNSSTYYEDLADRLQKNYPDAAFTRSYLSEIKADLNFADTNRIPPPGLSKVLWSLLAISILLNLYFIWKKETARRRKEAWKDETILTQQEQAILQEILEGRTNKEIASALFISLSTVKSHINSIYKKLDVASRRDLKSHFRK
jgi:DNA-binding CsgD family transcriptional regulator